jgi:hypothetical protein
VSQSVRFATFNISLSDNQAGVARNWVSKPNDPRLNNLAEIIRSVNADVLLLCEMDHPACGGDDGTISQFLTNYLFMTKNKEKLPIYPYYYAPASNTGVLPSSNQSLHCDDKIAKRPVDALGFGFHEGQYGFVLLSKYPILFNDIRTWQKTLWRDFPHSQMPLDYYTETAQNILPLSSKNHVSVPIQIGNKHIHVLACHPTPPVFDGEEKRNWKRNSDELRLLMSMFDGTSEIPDDRGNKKALSNSTAFVVMGDLNADPISGDGDKKAIQRLLHHSMIHLDISKGKLCPRSQGGIKHRPYRPQSRQFSAHWTHLSGLRLDYVLPSVHLKPTQSGVYWPTLSDPFAKNLQDAKQKMSAEGSSDHRLVWVDVLVSCD